LPISVPLVQNDTLEASRAYKMRKGKQPPTLLNTLIAFNIYKYDIYSNLARFLQYNKARRSR